MMSEKRIQTVKRKLDLDEEKEINLANPIENSQGCRYKEQPGQYCRIHIQ